MTAALALTKPPACECGSLNVDPIAVRGEHEFLVSFTNADLFRCNACAAEFTPEDVIQAAEAS